MSPSEFSFRANIAERWLQPRAASLRADPGRYLAPLIVIVVYGLVFFLLAFENRFEPIRPAPPEEIPIEIVAEPPPPPPPPKPEPPPAPQPSEQPLDEKPAFDAPRPANDEKVDRDAPDKVTKAPAEPPPVKPPGQEAETGQTPGPKPEAETPAKEIPADPDKDKTVAEPAENGDVKRTTPEPPPEKEAELPPQKPAASAGSRFPTFESVPDVDFGGASRDTPIAGGNAKATYLSIIYGMIVAHLHKPTTAHPRWPRSLGKVVFEIDSKGNLTQRWIAESSGSPELDAAVFDAIGRASPFPPPPTHRPAGLNFIYHSE